MRVRVSCSHLCESVFFVSLSLLLLLELCRLHMLIGGRWSARASRVDYIDGGAGSGRRESIVAEAGVVIVSHRGRQQVVPEARSEQREQQGRGQ